MASEQTSHTSGSCTAAMCDAMIARIRELGNNILAIKRAAVQRVEELDAAYAQTIAQKQQRAQQQQQQQSSLGLIASQNVRVKNMCTFKSVPQGIASKLPQRQTFPGRPSLGGKAGVGLSASSTLSSVVPNEGCASMNHASNKSKQKLTNTPRGVARIKKRKPRTLSSPLEKAAPVHNDDEETTATPRNNQTAAKMKHPKSKPTLQNEEAKKPVSNNHSVHADKPESALKAEFDKNLLLDILKVAEDSYQRVVAQSRTRPNRSEGDSSPVPLYNLSSAGFIHSNTANDAAASRKESRGAMNVGTAVDGDVTLSPRCCLESLELPDDVGAELEALSLSQETNSTGYTDKGESPPHAMMSQPTSSNYYCVVYIHQFARVRKQSGLSSPGSEQSSTRSLALRRRLTPHLVSPTRSSLTVTENENEEEPRMVNSYVSAMYAVADRDRNIAGDNQHNSSAINKATTLPPIAAAGRYVANAEPVIQVELRMPTCRSCSSVRTLSASHVSTPSGGAACIPPTWGVEHEKSDTEEKRCGGTVKSAHQISPVESGGQAGHTAAIAADAEGNNEEVAAQIETIEGWRRDRRTNVEQRIRKRRSSSFVVPGWQGEYYYYTSPPRRYLGRVPAHIAQSPSAIVALRGTAANEGLPYSTELASNSNGELLSSSAAPTMLQTGGDDVHGAPKRHIKDSRTDEGFSNVMHMEGEDNGTEETPKRYFPLLRAQYSSLSSPQQSVGRVVSPCSVIPATTYDVLLQTRMSASASSTMRSPRKSMIPAREPDGATANEEEAAVKVDGHNDDQQHSAATTATALTSEAATEVVVAATTVDTASSCSFPPSSKFLSPQPRPGSGSAGTSRRRHYPCLEVVVASDYNPMEWAFAGAARRASAMSDETATEKSASSVHPFPSLTAAAAAAPSTPLWVAFQRQELAEEEHRCWEAQTGNPYGADIHTPIVLKEAL